MSSGYDALAADFAKSRSEIGAASVRSWAATLGPGAEVFDAGCGTGVPITAALLAARCRVWAIDASPQMVELFKARFPDVPVRAEAVESTKHFGRRFDAVLAWGLLFLLEPSTQADVLSRLADALRPGGELLFTAPRQACEWQDALTGRASRSLGADEYERLLESRGLTLVGQFDDEGGNHYYQAVKPATPQE